MNAVELHNVYQQYGQMAVLDNISLTLAEGEVLGLFGHDGAGEATTVRLILGLLQATNWTPVTVISAAKLVFFRRTLLFIHN